MEFYHYLSDKAFEASALSFVGSISYALDSESSQALKKTQEMLRDSKKRMNAINSSEKGKAAHEKLKGMFQTSDQVDKAYEMAAQMMGVITKKAGGDSQKMQQLLNKGLNDPASLAERMPAEFKKMLSESASEFKSLSKPQKH